VRDVRYYWDRPDRKNPREWPADYAFAATIQVLTNSKLPTYQLIENW
jgi:hypothetical protein